MVADLSKPLQLRGLANFDKADVRRFFWVNNRRLVYDAQDLQSWRETGNGGLFAIDLDGSHFVRLIAAQFDFHQENTGSIIKSRILPTTYVFHSTLPGDTDDVVVAEYAFLQSDPYNEDHVRLVRLNTRTQEQRDLLDNQPPWVHWWLLDGDGHPRIAVSTHKNIWRVHYREKGSPAWKVLDEKDALDPAAIGPSFIGFDDLLLPGRAPDRLLEACRGVSAPMPRIFARSAVRQSAGYRAAWRQLRVPNPIARCGAAGAVGAEELLGPEPGRF